MLGESLGQALVKCSVFHVDHHAADVIIRNPIGDAVCFVLGRRSAHRDISGAVREQNQQWKDIRVKDFFSADEIMSEGKAGGKGGFSAHRDVGEGAPGQLDGIRWRQDERGAIFLEDDQPHPIASLVSIGQQGENGAFRGSHSLCDRHGPGSVHHKEHQVGGALYAYFPLKVGRADGEGKPLSLFAALPLIGGCGAQGGIECQVGGLPLCRASLDIAAAFPVGMGARAAARLPTCQTVERSVQPARGKGFPNLDFLTTLPPGCIAGVKDFLGSGRQRTLIRALFQDFLAQAFFFSMVSASLGSGSGSPAEVAP